MTDFECILSSERHEGCVTHSDSVRFAHRPLIIQMVINSYDRHHMPLTALLDKLCHSSALHGHTSQPISCIPPHSKSPNTFLPPLKQQNPMGRAAAHRFVRPPPTGQPESPCLCAVF